jgi:hypothetical protein
LEAPLSNILYHLGTAMHSAAGETVQGMEAVLPTVTSGGAGTKHPVQPEIEANVAMSVDGDGLSHASGKPLEETRELADSHVLNDPAVCT